MIPNLILKLGRSCISMDRLKQLREVARFVDELANLQHNKHQPFVGDGAFAHKGGLHVSAVAKRADMYEHVDPAAVGNVQRVLISDLSGRSNLLAKAAEFGVEVGEESTGITTLLERLKELEAKGDLWSLF